MSGKEMVERKRERDSLCVTKKYQAIATHGLALADEKVARQDVRLPQDLLGIGRRDGPHKPGTLC